MPSKTAKRVWGYLEFTNGTDLDLQGELLEDIKILIGNRKIADYGRKDIGNEANICTYSGKNTEREYKGLTAIRRLFYNYGDKS